MITDKMFKRKLQRMKKQGERYKKEKEITDAYEEYLPDRKKRKVSNIMLVVIVVAIVGYAIASFWLQYATGTAIDSTLTTLWFSFWTAEILALTSIRNYKTKYKTDEE